MIPGWHQLVPLSGHVEESETARKLQLYATSIKTSVSTRLLAKAVWLHFFHSFFGNLFSCILFYYHFFVNFLTLFWSICVSVSISLFFINLSLLLMHASKGILNLPTWSLHLYIHLLNKIVSSGFTISSPLFQNNWVKIQHRENKVGWRFTKFICFF